MKPSHFTAGKTMQEKLDYLNSLQYSIILRKKKDQFYLIIPELSLVTLNENLDKAYKVLHEQKQKLFTHMLECEAEDEIRIPEKTHDNQDTFHQLKLFSYKLLIICFLAGVTLTVSEALLANKVATISVAKILTQGGAKVLSRFESKFLDAPEEIKQQRIEQFREFVEALQPFTQELQLLVPSLPQEDERKKK